MRCFCLGFCHELIFKLTCLSYIICDGNSFCRLWRKFIEFSNYHTHLAPSRWIKFIFFRLYPSLSFSRVIYGLLYNIECVDVWIVNRATPELLNLPSSAHVDVLLGFHHSRYLNEFEWLTHIVWPTDHDYGRQCYWLRLHLIRLNRSLFFLA